METFRLRSQFLGRAKRNRVDGELHDKINLIEMFREPLCGPEGEALQRVHAKFFGLEMQMISRTTVNSFSRRRR